MGRRDYRHREPKKTKKDARKASPVTGIPSPVNVEIVRKAKKAQKEVEEEQEQ